MRLEPRKWHCYLSDTSPTYRAIMQQGGLPRPREYLRFCPLLYNRHAETKKMAQMKEQIKAPEIELSNEEIANLSDAEFKTLVIRMLTELIELEHKMKEEMKATQSEIKENMQGTNSKGRKPEPKSTIWSRRKK